MMKTMSLGRRMMRRLVVYSVGRLRVNFHISLNELCGWTDKLGGDLCGSDESAVEHKGLCPALYIAIEYFFPYTSGGHFCEIVHQKRFDEVLNSSFAPLLPA